MRLSKLLPIVLILAILLAVAPTHAQDGGTPPRPTHDDLSPAETASSGSIRSTGGSNSIRLASDLAQLYSAYQVGTGQGGTAGGNNAITQTARQYNFKIKNNDRVQVMIVATDPTSATQLQTTVLGLNGEITAHFDKWIDLYIPVSNLVALAQLKGVLIVRRPIAVYAVDAEPTAESLSIVGRPDRIGSNLTQGYNAAGMGLWDIFGQRGQGVHVAIIDSFYNYQNAQALGELPSNLQVYGALDTSSPHGTAVAEIIYDMAPGAVLTIASPSDTATSMAQYILALAQAGNRVISSSIGSLYYSAGDGNDPVSVAIAQARASYNTLYFQAGGNQAQKHWDGNWTDVDSDGNLEFSGSAEVNEVGYTAAGTYITLYLRWNGWPTTNQDYDLYLYRWNAGTSQWESYASSLLDQGGLNLTPEEGIEVVASSSAYYGFVIRRYNATGTPTFSAMSYRQSFLYSVPDRSLIDPATGGSTIGVAALDVNSPYVLESYSSRGPTYGPGGTFGGGTAQPRIAGYANVNTWAYGPNGFNGTSSATPHVAGAAAVVIGAYPFAPASQIQSFLESHAIDMGNAGWDPFYGYGRLNLGNPPSWDALAMFSPATNAASVLYSIHDAPASNYYLTFATGVPATGQWVMGDWNGDGWRTPGLYNDSTGVFFFTNDLGTTVNWTQMWFGLFNRPPVAGRFGAGNNDCIGVVDNGYFPPYGTAFAMYYTCNMIGGNPPKSFQWLSVVLPDNQGHSGAFQFSAGDWNVDGRDTIAIRRGAYVAFTNIPVTGNAQFNLAQYWGVPSGSGYGRFVSGDWNGDGVHSFGVVYDDGYFYRRDDLDWNSGVYKLQRVSLTLGGNFTVASWQPAGQSTVTGASSGTASSQAMPSRTALIESDDVRVTRIGTWSVNRVAGASGGQTLTSGLAAKGSGLILPFDGTSIEIIYANSGVFTVWVDDVAVRTIIATGDGAQGQHTRLDYLPTGPHTLRIEAVQGSVSIDAFIVNPAVK